MMKKYIKIGLLIALCAVSTVSQAVVDWTSYMKPLQHNCNISHEMLDGLSNNTLPFNIASSIDKVVVGKLDQEGFGVRNYYLSNAKAFGYSLKRIKLNIVTHDVVEITLYFNSKDILPLKSKFTLGDKYHREVVGTQKYWVVTENNQVKYFSAKQIPKDYDKREKFVYSNKSDTLYANSSTNYHIDVFGEVGNSHTYLKFDEKQSSIMCGYSFN